MRDESNLVVQLCGNFALVDMSGQRVGDDRILEDLDVVPGIRLGSGSRVS